MNRMNEKVTAGCLVADNKAVVVGFLFVSVELPCSLPQIEDDQSYRTTSTESAPKVTVLFPLVPN